MVAALSKRLGGRRANEPGEVMSNRPNILLITSDQQHYSTLGAVNDRIQTPALDRLCAEGTRFDRAYCPNPTCTPTRASIITGQYPSQHGAWSLGTKLFEDVPTIGDILGRAGYATGLIGKAHLQPLASRPGYESLECQPLLRDLDFWRGFQGPWYGFEHIEVARMHGDESHAGQHYAAWLEDQGVSDWRKYFRPWPADSPEGRQVNVQEYWQSDDRVWDLPEELHYTRWTAERTIAFLERAQTEGRPFLAWASFHDPHPPYVLPQPWAGMYDPADMQPGRLSEGEHDANPVHFGLTQQPDGKDKLIELFHEDEGIHGFHCHLRDEETMRKDMAIYYGMVSFMDQQIGRILQTLDLLGQADNTLVVFSTDHGHFLGQHGLVAKGPFHYEDLIRVPLIVRYPGQVPAGRTSNAIQNLVDLSPTFLSATGEEVPGTMTGLDQLPAWAGGEPVRSWSITENRHTLTKVHLRTYVNDRYKLTVYRSLDDGELFDLQQDPGEVRNLWHDPSAAELKGRLLQEMMQATMACEPTPMPRIYGA
jgi:arylsulfatase A-like enzyme